VALPGALVGARRAGRGEEEEGGGVEFDFSLLFFVIELILSSVFFRALFVPPVASPNPFNQPFIIVSFPFSSFFLFHFAVLKILERRPRVLKGGEEVSKKAETKN